MDEVEILNEFQDVVNHYDWLLAEGRYWAEAWKRAWINDHDWENVVRATMLMPFPWSKSSDGSLTNG